MGAKIDSILDKIFGSVPGSQVSTVDKDTASAKSEKEAIANSGKQQLLVSSITQQRKFKPTVTSVPGTGGVNAPRVIQQFAVTANLSGGIKGGLTQQQVNDLRAKPFTEQELEDIKRLDLRRAKAKGTEKFKLKDPGSEVVQKKREQAAIAKGVLTSRFGGQTFVGGKLFAKPLFATGGRRV